MSKYKLTKYYDTLHDAALAECHEHRTCSHCLLNELSYKCTKQNQGTLCPSDLVQNYPDEVAEALGAEVVEVD